MKAIEAAASLGGVRVLGARVRSEVDFVHLVEEGLPTDAVDRLMELGDLSKTEMDEIIPRRTLSHQRKRARLSPEQSDRIARAALAFTHAHETFGSRQKANRWMRQPNRALSGDTPLSLLRTGSGGHLVETILTRIAHGVYS